MIDLEKMVVKTATVGEASILDCSRNIMEHLRRKIKGKRST
ncbi:hypothetical protein [Sulfodiicoccus acidiphilus]|nr:hypothetical protein [Sulfodiicoccus acidiphilus]